MDEKPTESPARPPANPLRAYLDRQTDATEKAAYELIAAQGPTEFEGALFRVVAGRVRAVALDQVEAEKKAARKAVQLADPES
jgi:hypothetical protein